MRSFVFALVALLALSLRPGSSSAWEAATTHAGLTEQSALHSTLHDRLRTAFGEERGLFAALTVPPADAPALFQVLRTLNPTHGHVPDSRGRLLALGWLAAGSVLADMPPAHAANHFFDPGTGRGLSDTTLRVCPPACATGCTPGWGPRAWSRPVCPRPSGWCTPTIP
jgi:hypothetical protein